MTLRVPLNVVRPGFVTNVFQTWEARYQLRHPGRSETLGHGTLQAVD